jgi:hypothetical protein
MAAPSRVMELSGSLSRIAPSRTANTDSDIRTVAEVVIDRERSPIAHRMVGTEVHRMPTYNNAGMDIVDGSPGPPVSTMSAPRTGPLNRWKAMTHSSLSMFLTARRVRG